MIERMKDLVDDMWEELEGACHYAQTAVAAKGVDAHHVSTYSEMAKQELAHFDNLHKMAVEMVSEHHDNMHIKAIWEWEHNKMMRKAAKVKAMLEMAKI